ncbi:MAG: hypothetical protein R3A80_02780 [Bdellovibrionota bacterium]
MNIRVYASSVLGVWSALRLQDKGFPVELVLLKNVNESFRPTRVPRSLLTSVIEQLTRLGIPVSNILEAPVVRGWISPTGEIFERVWSEKGLHEERWIDTARLRESLLRACELEGVLISEVDVFPAPQWEEFRSLGIYEATANDVSHWTKAFHSYADNITYEVTEILFPRGMESALQKILFFEFDGVKGSLENLNRQKSVLTLISRSRILVDQILDDLRTRLSERQTGQLRALFALNPHVFRRDYKCNVGESGLYIPQFCLLGSGLGSLPALMNTHTREGFKQIARLEELLEKNAKGPQDMDPVRIAEDWYQSERRGFLRLLAWQRGWEEWLWSRMRQSWALRVQQYLPGKLRDLLRSPL